MSREIVVTCDVCGRRVSDVMRDEYPNHTTGHGYTTHKRTIWQFVSKRLCWMRLDDGVQIVCDYCWDAVREMRSTKESSE